MRNVKRRCTGRSEASVGSGAGAGDRLFNAGLLPAVLALLDGLKKRTG